MPKLPVVLPKKLVKILKGSGFCLRHSVGSHRIYKHSDGRRVVVPMHNKEIPKGTLLVILDDIKITKEKFQSLL